MPCDGSITPADLIGKLEVLRARNNAARRSRGGETETVRNGRCGEISVFRRCPAHVS
jgi:hypothetical protein